MLVAIALANKMARADLGDADEEEDYRDPAQACCMSGKLQR